MTACLRTALALSFLVVATTGPAQEVQFNRDIRPILSANCFACHGFDAKNRQAELRLDVPDGAFAQKDGVAAIIPGDLPKSAVWQRITSTDPDQIMPPPASHKTLKPEQIATIKRWIEQGARYQKHWAFEPITTPSEPKVQQAEWARNPIDRFLLAKTEAAGLKANRDAPKSTLIRRVSFALTGLPPTLEELRQFESDSSPNAYEKMVQRYLDSPHFGEEMARHWLDVARYADTHGLHLDNEREMWAYRDWVVDAFNRNLPFDQFTVEQLAGDLLPNPTKDQLIATGFNRCNVTTSEGGSIAEEFLYRYAVDRTSTTVQAWLGLTAGCAVCHDHKFDPLTTKEFYSLYAFFYSAADPAMDKNVRDTDPFLSLATSQQEAELAKLKAAEESTRQTLDRIATAIEVSQSNEMRTITDVWLDDVFPPAQRATTTSRNKATWITSKDGDPVPSGLRALRQAGAGMYQDRIETIGVPLTVPENAKLEWWVRVDRREPPQSVMLELTTSRGARRILLGDAEKLGSGKVGTPERLRLRDLPPGGEWTALSVTAEQLDLKPGDMIRGLAFVQFGGIVDWDGLRITGELAANDDPRSSFTKWRQVSKGQDVAGVPAKFQTVLKAGPKAESKDDAASAVDVANSPEALKTADDVAALENYWRAHIARPTTTEWSQARHSYDAALAARTAFEDQIPGTFIFKDVDKPREAFVMQRGQYDKPGEKVEPATPAVLPPLKLASADRRPNRLDLAKWLVAPEQPLTARVAVNRVWQQLFGVGLVKTSEDFGSQGELPSHPELLDWLATWYREHNWDTKDLVRLLVTSSAFRQDAAVTPDELATDPANRLYARGPRFRLDAEQLRDNALFVSGLIDLRRGGEGVKPYQPPNIWEPVGYADSNTRFYLQDHGDKLYRRSLYCFLKRTAPPPFMSNFDGPNREQLCSRRERSNTPLQALQLMNDTQHIEAARAFAERMLKGGDTAFERISFAYRTVLSRDPSADEAAIIVRTLERYRDRYREDPASASKLVHVGESSPMTIADPSELAAYTLIANLVLNLDEAITRN